MSLESNICLDDTLATTNTEQQHKDNETTFLDSDILNQQNGLQSRSVSGSLGDHKGKKWRKKRQQQLRYDGPCYIQQLSIELLMHVFSRLDPTSLATVAMVCRYWRQIVTDDNCWKDAFQAFFGTLPFRRLCKDSWKSEYILRTHLIRKWEKGRGSIIQFNPKVGSIDAIAVDMENSTMLAASAEQGMAVRCNPVTGKVDKQRLFSTDDGVPIRVNAVKLDRQRILWGFNPGFITMTTRTKSPVGRQLRAFGEFHQGPVTALAMPVNMQDIVLSAGEDGTVKIWDVPTATCIESLSGVMARPTCLDVTKDYRVVAGYANGTVVVWNIHVGQIAKEYRERQHQRQMGQNTPSHTPTDRSDHRLVIPPPSVDANSPVQSLKHDGDKGVIVVAYSGSQDIYKYDMETGDCLMIFSQGHLVGTISCMEWDTSPWAEATSYMSIMKTRANRSGAASFQGTPESDALPKSKPTKYTRLLVSGDTSGTVCVWNGDATTDSAGGQIQPWRVLNGHHASISALFVDGFKVVSGSNDGWIRIWDPLTGSLLNIIGNKIPRHAPVDRTDVNVTSVKNIWCDNYRGVATIGHQIKTWDFSPDKQLLDKHQLRPKARVPGNDPRHLQYELKQDLKESKEILKQERKEQERHARFVNKMTLGGLSDEELLAYALMISQEDTNMKRQQTDTVSQNENGSDRTAVNGFSAGDYVDDDEELMQAVIASLSTSENVSDAQSSSSFDEMPPPPQQQQQPANHDQEDEWPAVGEDNASHKWQKRAIGRSSSSSTTVWNYARSRGVASPSPHGAQDNDYDEELEYVLKLSQTEV